MSSSVPKMEARKLAMVAVLWRRIKCGNDGKYQIRSVGDGGGLEDLRSSIKVQLL